MKKRVLKKVGRKELSNRIIQLEQELAKHEEDRNQNLSSYSKSEIFETLSELSVGTDTYEFLGELFFEFLANEVRTTSPSPERLNLYINTRHQIHQLYELARAAKALRTHQHQQVGE
ncbi:hypothetical protein ACFQ21_22755 [Ohtaekwangia kribbensis]|uniref:Uncharacterized protein n=1 Tax=Ohtaekwangia kribbensis TaxID=688913 RepID=A0ABW3K7N9_9BACT